jgi:hypothetical protein
VGGSCEHGNEPSDFMKCWEGLVDTQLVASREGLSSMELANI